jgi:SAM-dependent methyltransferase
LDYTVRKEIMFGDHTYLSGVTKSLSEHFRGIAAEVDDRFFNGKVTKRVLDIGSNDGTQLKHFKALGWDALGVESSTTTAAIANAAGLETVNAFFNLQTLRELDRRFDCINAAGVFFHLEELHSVTQAVKEGLDKDGVFVVQFLYMGSIMENGAFDQIYHEHLLYYTLKTLSVLLKRHGLELFDAYLAPIHGGQMIGFAGHVGEREQSARLKALFDSENASGCNEIDAYRTFARRIERMKEENLAYLQEARRKNKRVFGMGAPVKGNTMLNYFGVGPELIECLLEKNELRRGLFSPGMHIPILIEGEVDAVPDIYYVLAWNFKKEILANNQALIERGVEFYFPVDPKVSA